MASDTKNAVLVMHSPEALKWEPVEDIVERHINPDRRHLWPFERSFPVDVRFLRLNRNHDVPLHHPDHLEIVCIESGEIGYEVGSSRHLLRTGDLIIVGGGIWHRCLRTESMNSEIHGLVLSFLPDLVLPSSGIGEDMNYLLPFNATAFGLRNIIPSESGVAVEISSFIRRIRSELPAGSNRARLAVRTYLKLILMLVLNHFADSVETRAIMNRGHDRLERLMPLFEHIDSHSGEPIRVGDAARISAMTVPYFMHFFRKSTGRTFIGYLNSFRVARAQSLLSSTDKSIVDISYETGFCNQSYFGVIFRRVAGMTPLDYRRRSRGSQNPPPAAARLGDSELSQSLPILLPSVCHLEVSYLDQPPAGQIGPHGTARL
jgi:AraC family transcriptional regulator, transcriptional activator of pobA